jgi:hypothetical protein
MASGKADGEGGQRALIRGTAVYLRFHRAQAIDDQRGVELVHCLPD